MAVTTTVRWPEDLHDALKQIATRDERSFNQIVIRLCRERLNQATAEPPLVVKVESEAVLDEIKTVPAAKPVTPQPARTTQDYSGGKRSFSPDPK